VLIYINNDVMQFIYDGIIEEEEAKEKYKALTRTINNREFSAFFDFITLLDDCLVALILKPLPKEG